MVVCFDALSQELAMKRSNIIQTQQMVRLSLGVEEKRAEPGGTMILCTLLFGFHDFLRRSHNAMVDLNLEISN